MDLQSAAPRRHVRSRAEEDARAAPSLSESMPTRGAHSWVPHLNQSQPLTAPLGAKDPLTPTSMVTSSWRGAQPELNVKHMDSRNTVANSATDTRAAAAGEGAAVLSSSLRSQRSLAPERRFVRTLSGGTTTGGH